MEEDHHLEGGLGGNFGQFKKTDLIKGGIEAYIDKIKSDDGENPNTEAEKTQLLAQMLGLMFTNADFTGTEDVLEIKSEVELNAKEDPHVGALFSVTVEGEKGSAILMTDGQEVWRVLGSPGKFSPTDKQKVIDKISEFCEDLDVK